MVNHLHDSIVSIRDESTDAEAAQPDGHSSPPLTLAQVFASIHESRVEQTELLRLVVANSSRGNIAVSIARDQARSTYVEFLTSQSPTFIEADEPLEADHWLRTIESKFELLHCTENQKILFVAQKLLGDVRAWWTNFTATFPANQVEWAEFYKALCVHHIPAGIMKSKHQKIMDL
jgi:hypothetical protein